MIASSRHIYLYWVLLLLPTLGVGVGAFYLLNREEGRLLARAGQLEEARRTALRARAQLAAENAELIISDLEWGLLDTLASAPAENPDEFLQSLERANPLVHATFRCDVNGTLLRPLANAEDEEARAFHRRFYPVLRAAPFVLTPQGEVLARPQPFGVATEDLSASVAKKDAASEVFDAVGAQRIQESTTSEAPSPNQTASSQERQAKDSSNYATNVQRARRDVQSIAKIRSEPARPSVASKTSASPALFDRKESSPAAPGKQLASSAARASATLDADKREAFASEDSVEQDKGFSSSKLKANREQTSALANGAVLRGWLPVTLDQRLFLLGYVRPAGTEQVHGIELDLTALVSRLGAALPPDLARGEGLCLLDERGRVFHQVGSVPSNNSAPLKAGKALRPESFLVRVPLNGALLPGWSIEAYLSLPTDTYAGGTSSFLLTGSLLAAILVIALLSGGFLLLQQARASAQEALVKTSFVANVSHELKTPLTTIRLYSDLLEQGRVPSEERRAEYLRTIGRESERLSRLVNNVLDFSRLERGLQTFTLARLDPAAELRRICEVNTPRLTEAGLRLSLLLPDEPLGIAADRDALAQILLNLLDNAVKYASTGGELRVSLSKGSEGRILIGVADRGPGVPASERERVFLKFHRVDQSLTAEKGGAGLGLSIARQLARAMKGDLRCLPREGGGAIFELSLPSADREILV